MELCHNLPLVHGVQRRCGLIGNDDIGALKQRHRDHTPLQHASGKLVRIFLEHIQRIVDVPSSPEPQRCVPCSPFPKKPMSSPGVFQEAAPHGVKRIERRHRLLDYHGDSLAAGCRARFPDLPARGRCARNGHCRKPARKEAPVQQRQDVSDLPLPLSPTTPRQVPGSRQKCTSRTISAPVRESRTVKSRTSSKLMNVPCPRVWDQRRHAGCRLKN